MAGLIGSSVTLEGFYSPHDSFTWNITDAGGAAGNPATAGAAGVHQAMTIDATAANSAKLAGADSLILGPLLSLETRGLEGIKVGAITTRGGYRFAYTGTLLVGQSVVGSATAGAVKVGPSAGAFDNRTLVVEVDSGAGTAVVLFI